MAPVKKILNYSNEQLNNALNAISKGISKKMAAAMFKVPRTTLINKIQGRYRDGKRIGRDPYLSCDEEGAIVQ